MTVQSFAFYEPTITVGQYSTVEIDPWGNAIVTHHPLELTSFRVDLPTAQPWAPAHFSCMSPFTGLEPPLGENREA